MRNNINKSTSEDLPQRRSGMWKRGNVVGVEVTVPIKADDYQYIKLGVWYETTVEERETDRKAYRRAWAVAEEELQRKRDEYIRALR